MGAFIRRAVLGIAVLLGFADPAEPPILDLRLHRTEDGIVAEAELIGFPGESLAELVKAGNDLAVILSLRTPNAETDTRTHLSFDGNQYHIRGEGGGARTTESETAAFILAGLFDGVPVPGVNAASDFPVTLFLECRITLPADPSYDPMILWGYKPAVLEHTITAMEEIPF